MARDVHPASGAVLYGPALETVTGHNWKREEKVILLIRQHTFTPLGNGGMYPRICNCGAIDQCFSNFVRPQPGKSFFHKKRGRSQQIYS